MGASPGSTAPRIRASRMGRRRAWVLLAVHLVFAAHVAWWLTRGRAVGPLEPSEGMAFAREGLVNAGLIFFGAMALATLVLGRFFCGWACHMVALQDLCRHWMLKAGVRPVPLRSRLLKLVPLAAFVYMFLWPYAVRWWRGEPQPGVAGVEWTTHAFWSTFPGWAVALITFVVCGFAVVWFLGSKGYCTYACPYGALFGALDAFAPGRIRVTDDCEQCGHCTATCSSDVRVHEEVRTHGAVVDPGCMKCMDCVSVCPKDALYFGFGKPAAFTGARAEPRDHGPRPLPWSEEAVGVAGFLVTFFATRGLYGVVPFLLALGLGGLGAWLAIVAWRLARRPHVRAGSWSLKRDGRLRPSGRRLLVAGAVAALLLGHSGWVQAQAAVRDDAFARTAAWRNAWLRAGPQAAGRPPQEQGERAASAARAVGAWALMADARNPYVEGWHALMRGDAQGFEEGMRRVLVLRPGFGEVLFQFGHYHRVRGEFDEAAARWAAVSPRDPRYGDARLELATLREAQGRAEDARAILEDLRARGFHEAEGALRAFGARHPG